MKFKLMTKVIKNCNECDHAQGPLDSRGPFADRTRFDYYCTKTEESFGYEGYPEEIPDSCPLKDIMK